MSWYQSLPPAETSVPCGDGTHTIRWEEGRLTLPDHADAEAELVLGALGGDKPDCLTLTETWDAHADDLAILAAGPRSASDRTTITRGQIAGTGSVSPRRFSPAAENVDGELARRARNRAELLELLALGPEFQFRLSGAVASSWAGGRRAEERAGRLPELAAALTGRFAPVAAEWLGVDPDAVTVIPHEGPGWGSLEAAGDGGLTGALGISWLADVWACGLALADGHLVVSVTEPGYPRARVLALPEPGTDPVPLEIDHC